MKLLAKANPWFMYWQLSIPISRSMRIKDEATQASLINGLLHFREKYKQDPKLVTIKDAKDFVLEGIELVTDKSVTLGAAFFWMEQPNVEEHNASRNDD